MLCSTVSGTFMKLKQQWPFVFLTKVSASNCVTGNKSNLHLPWLHVRAPARKCSVRVRWHQASSFPADRVLVGHCVPNPQRKISGPPLHCRNSRIRCWGRGMCGFACRLMKKVTIFEWLQITNEPLYRRSLIIKVDESSPVYRHRR